MKKYLIGLFVSTSLIASSNFDVGIAKSDVDSKQSDNVYVSYSIASDDEKEDKGFLIGIGIDYLAYSIPKYTYNTNTNSYVLSPQLILGYKYKRLQIKGSIGYGVHRIDDKNYWGASYDVAIEAKVYRWFGIGFKYKEWSNSYDRGYPDTGSANIFYLRASF